MSEENNDTPLILIADDQEATVQILSHLFSSRGYRIEVAYDGEEALKKARKHIPDLLLLDVMMPGLNGFQVLETLNDTEATASIPAILLTAKAEPEDIKRGLELGADDYVTKPFKNQELLARAQGKIEAQKLRRTLQRRTKDMEALLRVSEELNHRLDINELLHLILYLVLDLLPGDVAAIYLVDEQQRIYDSRITHKKGHDDLLNETAIYSFLNHSQDHDMLWPPEKSLFSEFAGGMVVKLEYGLETHGVLLLLTDTSFDDYDLRLFRGISRQATSALQNAKLYEVKTHYAEHLEDMVEERTEELRSAQQLLIRSERLASIGRLAAGIAHEINNPLFPIRINLEHMVEDLQAQIPIHVQDVEETLSSVERIGRIVQRLLMFTGKGQSNMSEMKLVNINDIINDVISLGQKFLEKENVNITAELVSSPSIYGSRDQLEQVFLNIILNAKAAMMKGGDIHIQTRVEQDEIVVDFTDTGEGIAPDILERIFEPFVSTREDGTGLGLFISYGIIENHQGSINAISEVGSGTAFTIRLPISQQPTAP